MTYDTACQRLRKIRRYGVRSAAVEAEIYDAYKSGLQSRALEVYGDHSPLGTPGYQHVEHRLLYYKDMAVLRWENAESNGN